MKKLLIIALLLGGMMFSYSQKHSGVALYKAKAIFRLTKDTVNGDKDFNKRLKQTKSKWEKGLEMLDFELSFNGGQSTFKKRKKVYKDEESEFMADIGSVFVTHPTYVNLKNQNIINQEELGGQLFLIKDSLPNFSWSLHNESKLIGKYQCYKATTKITQYLRGGKTKQELITVWYSPQIPIPFGPENYIGLPGLILEVSDALKTIYLVKLDLNISPEIEPFKKGKFTTEKELRLLRKKLADEMLGKN